MNLNKSPVICVVLASLVIGQLAADLQHVHAFPINAPNARTLFGGFSLGVADFRFTRETGAGQEVNVVEETLTGVHAQGLRVTSQHGLST